MHDGWPPNPLAVIRRVERASGNVPVVWYRVVTWATESAGRTLIGYCETGDDAAKAGWEHFHGRHAWCQHE